MLKQQLHRIIYSLLYPKLNNEEINTVRDRVYFECLKHKEIPIIVEKKIKWINMEKIYYVERIQNNVYIFATQGEFVLQRLSSDKLDLVDAMCEFDYFIKCTNNLFVNIYWVEEYDAYMQRLYFPSEIQVRVSQKIIKLIRGKLGKDKDRSKYL